MTSLKRLTVLTYAQQFVSECIAIYPLYALMFSQRSGLSVAEISMLLAWWLLVILLSELPTGLIADRFSKKYVLFLSNVLKAIAFGVWLLAPHFSGYALGFLIWGVGCALNTGAFQAYLYETLHIQKLSPQFTKIYTRSQSFALLGMVAGYLLASVIGANYPLLLTLSSLVSLISAGLILYFPAITTTQEPISQLSLLKGGVKEIQRSPAVLHIVLTLAIVTAIGQVGQEFTPLYYNTVGISMQFIPLLLAAGLGLSAFLAWIAHRFEQKNSWFQIVVLGIAGCILFVTSFQGMIAAMIGMLLFMRLVRLSSLLYESILQHSISARYRATIGSIPMFLGESFAIFIIMSYGVAAHFFGDRTSVRLLAALAIVSALLLLLYWYKQKLPRRYPHTPIVPIEERPGF